MNPITTGKRPHPDDAVPLVPFAKPISSRTETSANSVSKMTKFNQVSDECENIGKAVFVKKEFKEIKERSEKTCAERPPLKDGFRKGEAYFKRDIELAPNNSIAYVRLGDYFYNHLKFKEAAECYRGALKIEPTCSLYLVRSGDCYYHLNEFEEAEGYYKSASERDLKNSSALVGAGHCNRKRNDIPEALIYYENALKIDPVNFKSLYGLGKCEQAKRNFIKAEAYLIKCFELAVVNGGSKNFIINLVFELSSCARHLKQLTKTKMYLEKAMALEESTPDHFKQVLNEIRDQLKDFSPIPVPEKFSLHPPLAVSHADSPPCTHN